MSTATKIEWTRSDDGTAGATWNPVTGCDEVSEGCDNCYARTFAERWRGVPGHPFEQGFDVRLWPERLELPLRRRKPTRYFVNSMSDLFHARVPGSFVASVFGVMAMTPQHTYQVLTKRPRRMRALLTSDAFRAEVDAAADGAVDTGDLWLPSLDPVPWPLPNVWAGTSIENDDYTWRADCLRQVPAAVRFLSLEPLLGPLPSLSLDGIGWVIAGGESGPGHRTLDLGWARDIRDRCAGQDAAFFFKQVGGPTPKAGGRQLDGRTWDQMPSLAGSTR